MLPFLSIAIFPLIGTVNTPPPPAAVPFTPLPKTVSIASVPVATLPIPTVPVVPFYSQFTDIESPTWQKQGCGIASLAMIIDYYTTEPVSVNTLLTQGIARGAYDYKAGWIYKGLISLAQDHGLEGKTYDLKASTNASAFNQFKDLLEDGPIIVSIHYKFDPKNPIPHLVVINGIENDIVHYNDPAAKNSDKEISVTDFLKAWKKRFIVIRPAGVKVAVAI